MWPKNDSTNQTNQTFIEAARRAQIIEHAIDTIAELGYAQASLAQIAKRARISKGVISYHFTGKDELMGEVVRTVLTAFADYVRPRMDAETTLAGQLRVFIEANLTFIDTHRKSLLAALDIMDNARTGTGELLIDTGITEADINGLQALLIEGQQQGEFRSFDPRVMAVSILALRNGVISQLATNPDIDLDTYRREIVTMIELATRNMEGT